MSIPERMLIIIFSTGKQAIKKIFSINAIVREIFSLIYSWNSELTCANTMGSAETSIICLELIKLELIADYTVTVNLMTIQLF